MSRPSLKVVQKLYANTVAIGWVSPNHNWDDRNSTIETYQKNLTVVGTGFLISDRVVMTAQHIVNGIRQKGFDWGEIVVASITCNLDKPKHANIQFRRNSVVYSVGVTLSTGEVIQPPRKLPISDLALIQMAEPATTILAPAPQGLTVIEPEHVMIGEPVINPSYFLSTEMLRGLGGSASPRFGPIFFHGHVASISPHGIRGHQIITDYHVDLTSAPGSSGSPVCTMEGDVIGILTGGVETPISGVEDFRLPRNLARVLPLTRTVVQKMLDFTKNSKPGDRTRVPIPQEPLVIVEGGARRGVEASPAPLSGATRR